MRYNVGMLPGSIAVGSRLRSGLPAVPVLLLMVGTGGCAPRLPSGQIPLASGRVATLVSRSLARERADLEPSLSIVLDWPVEPMLDYATFQGDLAGLLRRFEQEAGANGLRTLEVQIRGPHFHRPAPSRDQILIRCSRGADGAWSRT